MAKMAKAKTWNDLIILSEEQRKRTMGVRTPSNVKGFIKSPDEKRGKWLLRDSPVPVASAINCSLTGREALDDLLILDEWTGNSPQTIKTEPLTPGSDDDAAELCGRQIKLELEDEEVEERPWRLARRSRMSSGDEPSCLAKAITNASQSKGEQSCHNKASTVPPKKGIVVLPQDRYCPRTSQEEEPLSELPSQDYTVVTRREEAPENSGGNVFFPQERYCPDVRYTNPSFPEQPQPSRPQRLKSQVSRVKKRVVSTPVKRGYHRHNNRTTRSRMAETSFNSGAPAFGTSFMPVFHNHNPQPRFPCYFSPRKAYPQHPPRMNTFYNHPQPPPNLFAPAPEPEPYRQRQRFVTRPEKRFIFDQVRKLCRRNDIRPIFLKTRVILRLDQGYKY